MSFKDELYSYSEVALGIINSVQSNLRTSLEAMGLDEISIQFIVKRFKLSSGLYFSLQPEYRKCGESFRDFCRDHCLSPELADSMIRILGKDFRLFEHQKQAIESILSEKPTVISTGTGSGKTESFLIPIIDHCLKKGENGIHAILLYPMNALVNDQMDRLAKLTENLPLTFGMLTGATPDDWNHDNATIKNRIYSRNEMLKKPPNILLTNYIMLDRILTISKWDNLISASVDTLKYIVLDELHSYRGSRAAHLMLLLRRLQMRLNKPLIPIGASATLKTSAGIFSDSKADDQILREFLTSVLGVDECNVIMPEFVDLPDIEASPWPEKAVSPKVPKTSISITDQCELLSELAGKKLREREFRTATNFRETDFGDTITKHPFVIELKKSLRNDGAISLLNLRRFYQERNPYRITDEEAGIIVRQWLVAFNVLNKIWGDKPFLDLRLHLFIRALGGSLFRCIKCDSFHPEGARICPECSLPLFYVDKRDVRLCIGKVRKHNLSPELNPESLDKGQEFFVRIARADQYENGIDEDAVPCQLKMDTDEIPDEDSGFSIPFEPAQKGDYFLIREPEQKVDNLRHNLIELNDSTHPRQHLRELITSMLSADDDSGRKLLAFIDDREKASKEASILRDEFASLYLESILAKIYPTEPPYLSILETIQTLKKHVQRMIESGEVTEEENGILKELELWFYRYIGEPVRRAPTRTNLLRINDSLKLSEIEQKVLEVFLQERAIDVDFKDEMKDSQYIKFQKYWALTRRVFHLLPGQGSDQQDKFSISLSPNASEYHDFLYEIGIQNSELNDNHNQETKEVIDVGAKRIRDTVNALVARGIINKVGDNEKHRYSLNPNTIVFNPNQIQTLSKNKDESFKALIASHHSSELKPEERERVEELFRTGVVHFLLATPTLEMGIDIGELQKVMMVSVPPMPSNYAQRAGRAGRRGQLAMTLCYCSDNKAHDQYYFNRPIDMIDGRITPPAFFKPNWNLLVKHIRSILLRGHLDNRSSLDNFLQQRFKWREYHKQLILEFVSKELSVYALDYLNKEFFEDCEKLSRSSIKFNVKPVEYAYKTGFLPDYGFHHEYTYLYEQDKYRELSVLGEISPYDQDYISEREPELSITKFAPDRTGYFNGEIYSINTEGKYEEWNLPEDLSPDLLPIRSYKIITAEKEVRKAVKDVKTPPYNKKILYKTGCEVKTIAGVLEVIHDPECEFYFLNLGKRDDENFLPFEDEKGKFSIGYQLKREALIIRLPRQIFHDTKVPLSFLSTLDRTIKDRYRLDESEIKILTNGRPIEDFQKTDQELAKYNFIFYDSTGNSDLPFTRIYGEFDEILEQAKLKLTECPDCHRSGTNGCYYCLKSYYTQFIAPFASSVDALDIIDYLLGEKSLKPRIRRFELDSLQDKKSIKVEVKESSVSITTEGRDPILTNQQDAKSVYKAIADAVRKWFSPGQESLEILSNIGYLIEIIQGKKKVDKGKDAFAHLRFEFLKFNQVEARKL